MLREYDKEVRHNQEMSRRHKEAEYIEKEYPNDKAKRDQYEDDPLAPLHPIFAGLIRPIHPTKGEKHETTKKTS